MLADRRSRRNTALPGIHGTARVARLAGAAARRARPGEIAVLDHQDLDATSATQLIDARVAAVVNAAPSISGRYPNLGPRLLVEAGIPLLDRVGPQVRSRLGDGESVRLDGDALYLGEELVCHGQLLNAESVTAAMESARAGLGAQLEAFAHAAVEHLRRERDLLLDGTGAPAVQTPIAGRAVVVVTRGKGYDHDLSELRPWIRATRPVLVGVDDGADVLLAAGLEPHLVVGDPMLMSEPALECGAEVVVRTDRSGSVAGLPRLREAGVEPVRFRVSGTSEDAALLLVDAHEPALVVGVGWHPSLSALVDSGRTDMPSAFLTRLRVGDRFVDASAVAALYNKPARSWPLWLLIVLLLSAVVVGVALAPDATPIGEWRQSMLDTVTSKVDGWIGELAAVGQ